MPLKFVPKLVGLTFVKPFFIMIWFQSQNISKSVWESGWLDCNKRECQTLHIVMMRAQKPLTLSVGSLYVMSTETALKVSVWNLINFAYLICSNIFRSWRGFIPLQHYLVIHLEENSRLKALKISRSKASFCKKISVCCTLALGCTY